MARTRIRLTDDPGGRLDASVVAGRRDDRLPQRTRRVDRGLCRASHRRRGAEPQPNARYGRADHRRRLVAGWHDHRLLVVARSDPRRPTPRSGPCWRSPCLIVWSSDAGRPDAWLAVRHGSAAPWRRSRSRCWSPPSLPASHLTSHASSWRPSSQASSATSSSGSRALVRATASRLAARGRPAGHMDGGLSRGRGHDHWARVSRSHAASGAVVLARASSGS